MGIPQGRSIYGLPKGSKPLESLRLRLDLAMAMEDHDLNRIKRFLPVAQNLGVAPEVQMG